MRKVWIMCLALGLISSIGFAYTTDSVTEYNYELVNTTTTTKVTVIPTGSIRPDVDKITGYVVTPRHGQEKTELIGGLWDDTTVALTGEKLGEKESGDGGSVIERFDRPKKVSNGVVSTQGANTILDIYFIRE